MNLSVKKEKSFKCLEISNVLIQVYIKNDIFKQTKLSQI